MAGDYDNNWSYASKDLGHDTYRSADIKHYSKLQNYLSDQEYEAEKVTAIHRVSALEQELAKVRREKLAIQNAYTKLLVKLQDYMLFDNKEE